MPKHRRLRRTTLSGKEAVYENVARECKRFSSETPECRDAVMLWADCIIDSMLDAGLPLPVMMSAVDMARRKIAMVVDL